MATDEEITNGLAYFCDLATEAQEEFLSCPQVRGSQSSYFIYAKSIRCSSMEDILALMQETGLSQIIIEK